MWIKVDGKKSTEIDDGVISQILNLYPEENLLSNKDIAGAFQDDCISIKKLQRVGEKFLIPWQMFLLNKENLKKELEKIENIRNDKFPQFAKLTKRKGQGDITSKRILDRILRIQKFISDNCSLPKNSFCGSLTGKTPVECRDFIGVHFSIDSDKFKNYSDPNKSLQYLIDCVSAMNVNISQGVLANGMLPNHRIVNKNVYKNTSGFAIHDEKFPCIFLPSETNPDEVAYRQIYTLLYLLVAIGLNQNDYLLEPNFSYKKIKRQDKKQRNIHAIVSEVLLPSSVSDSLKKVLVTKELVGQLKNDFKISPTAILTILRIRKIISNEQYDQLKPPEFTPTASIPRQHQRSPNIETSVKKFCGKSATGFVNNAIKTRIIKPIPAQYILFGRVNKKKYKEYVVQAKI